MNEYLIEVLTKVSFDKGLFQKELNKSRRWLTTDEWEQLCDWATENYEYLLIGTSFVDHQNSVPAC